MPSPRVKVVMCWCEALSSSVAVPEAGTLFSQTLLPEEPEVQLPRVVVRRSVA